MGFGMITPLTGGAEIFAHHSNISGGNVLKEGELVEYEEGVKDGNPVALNIRGDAVQKIDSLTFERRPSFMGGSRPSSSNLMQNDGLGALTRQRSRNSQGHIRQGPRLSGGMPNRKKRNPFLERSVVQKNNAPFKK